MILFGKKSVEDHDLSAVCHKILTHCTNDYRSVREDAAMALGQVLRADNHKVRSTNQSRSEGSSDKWRSVNSTSSALKRCEKWLAANLMMAKEQTASKAAPWIKTMATQSVLNEEKGFGPALLPSEEPTDKQVYSCGSLAPKLQRGGAKVVKLENESVQKQTGSGGGCCL